MEEKAHLFPERRSCGKSMQLKLVTLQVEQGQVETFNLDQHLKKCQKWFQISSEKKGYKEPHLLVIRSCPLGFCSWRRTSALRDGALRASNLKGSKVNFERGRCQGAYHADINDLSRSLHSDNLKLAQAVLKLICKE